MKRNSNVTRIGGGQTLSDLRQSKRLWLSLILSFICAALLCCAFVLPKTGNINANAAGTIDVNPTIAYDNSKTKTHNIAGGQNGTTPADIAYSAMTGSSNINVQAGANSPYRFNNIGSTIDLDAAFAVFSMNVSVPAGGKITVQYKFDINMGKAADGTDSGSHFAAELFHFGSSDPINDPANANPVDVSTLSFATSSTSAAYSVLRLDGSSPTSIYSCSQYGSLVPSTHLNTSMYPSLGSVVSGCDPVKTGTYTTVEITYENTTNTNKVFKEFFGFLGVASTAQGCCHIFWTDLSMSTEKAEFEKTSKPQSSGLTSRDYDGTAKTFNLSGLNSKVALVKAEKTALDGTPTTLYEYTNWPASPKTETGTNPISGTNQCTFTDTGKYTLSFRPVGAVWTGTLDSTAVDVTFYVLPKKINKPTVGTAQANGLTYNGSAQSYPLALSGGLTTANWSQYINIDASQGGNLPAGVTDNLNGTFSITDVGDYDIYLTLVDPVNTCWNDSNFTATDWSGPAGGAYLVSLKMKPYEVTVSSLTCDQIISGNWAWNMGDTATVTLTISDFLLSSDTDENDVNKVSLIYYYCVGTSTTENPVAAKTEVYDPAAKTISATIEMPTTLAQGTYTFGVKPDDSVGAGKNYTVKTSLATKSFTVSAKGFDPSVLVWTYTVDGVSDTTKTIADGDKLTYTLKADGTATVYNPLIMLLTDTYDYTDKVAINVMVGTAGYSGSVDVSAVSASYATIVNLKIIDNDTKFVNTSNNSNVTVSADGKTATVKLNWEIEKADFDLSGLIWEYWYKDSDGNVQTGDYTQAIEYNDNRWIYVRIKKDSLPAGLSFNSNYTTVMPGYDTYGDRQKNVNTDANPNYTTQFDAASDFVYDTNSFNAPDATATTLKLDWQIAPKSIVAKFKLTKHTYSNANGSGSYYIRELDLAAMGVPENYADYFKLKYYDSTDAEKSLAEIDAAVDLTNEKTYTVKAVINEDVAAAKNYKIVDASGNVPTTTFKTGSSNTPAKFTIDGQDGSTPIKVTYDGNPQFGTNISVKDENGTVVPATDFDVIYYKGATPVEENALSGAPTDAGEYCVEVVLKNGAENIYILENEYISVTIEKIKIALPTVDEIIFGNIFVDLAEHLHGTYEDYKDIITLGGDVNGVKFVGTYNATLTITNPNYCWDYGTEAAPAKKLAKYALADDSVNWTGDETVANLKWSINPYVLKASGWNLKGQEGAVYTIPENLTENLDVALQLWYYSDKASEHLGEDDVLKAGSTYFVKAQLLGAHANNFIFEDSKATTSDFATYKVPQNGAAAFLNNVKTFMLGTWLGLPIWAWFAIGLAALILLIIIIAVCAKRRKTKEQREEIKARKEEEKQRREEERRMQQERLQAERELAMAKQQAELEKIRAQSGMAAGMGMASMAMQQQVPAQQVQPVQQPVSYAAPAADSSALAEIKAELAEIKARQNMMGGYAQPMQMPMPQYYQQPMQMPVQVPAQSGEATAVVLAKMEAEFAKMQLEFYKMQNGVPVNYNTPQISAPAPAPVQALPQPAQEEIAQPVAQYPSDAVITTTTTVDTTKKSETPSLRRTERDSSNEFSDVDGFYDSIDY